MRFEFFYRVEPKGAATDAFFYMRAAMSADLPQDADSDLIQRTRENLCHIASSNLVEIMELDAEELIPVTKAEWDAGEKDLPDYQHYV